MSEAINLFKANAILVHRYPQEAEQVDTLLQAVGVSCGITFNSVLVAFLIGGGDGGTRFYLL